MAALPWSRLRIPRQVSKPRWRSSRASSPRWKGGKLPLAESLAAYRRGAALLEYCQATLKDAQQQVEVLERGVLKGFVPTDANGSGNDES